MSTSALRHPRHTFINIDHERLTFCRSVVPKASHIYGVSSFHHICRPQKLDRAVHGCHAVLHAATTTELIYMYENHEGAC